MFSLSALNSLILYEAPLNMNGTEINEHNLYMTDAIMHESDHLVPGRLCAEGYQGVRQAEKDNNMKKMYQYNVVLKSTTDTKCKKAI